MNNKFLRTGITTIFAILLVTFATAANLDLVKSVDKSNPLTGETFIYTLQYRCASTTQNCNGVMITDPLPASVEFVNLSQSIHTSNAVYNSGTHTVTFTMNSPMAAGTVGQVSITVKFPDGYTSAGTVANNTATISASNASSKNASASATAKAFDRFNTQKGIEGGVPGEYTVYNIQLCAGSGWGTMNATDITVIDNLPANTIFHSADNGGVYNSSNHTVTWNVGTLLEGACKWLHVVVRFPSSSFSTGNSITNNANVYHRPVGKSIITTPISVTHTLTTPWREAYIHKRASNSTVRRGQGEFNHRFEFRNRSNVPINGFYLQDNFPTGFRPKKFDTGNFYVNVPSNNLQKYIKYKTNLNNSWTNVPGSPMNIWTDIEIETSSLGLANNEYITSIRWEFGPDPWPISSGLVGNIFIYYEDIPTSTPLGTSTNCIIAGGNNTINYNGSNRCVDVDVQDQTTGYEPSPRKEYTSNTCGGCFKNRDQTGDWFSPGDIVGFKIRARSASSSASNMPNPAIADLLPIGMEYVDGSYSYSNANTSNPAPAFSKTVNYKGTGRTHLRWDWAGVNLAPNENMTIEFYVRLTNAAGSGENAIRNTYAILNTPTGGCSIFNAAEEAADVDDLDNDGNTSEMLCFGYADIDILPAPALSSEKFIKGQLDNDWTRFPNFGNTVAGGVADYRLRVRNDGNVAIKDIIVVDILPFVGDQGVIDLSNRNSRWQPNLAGAVSAPAGVTVYYSTEGNPCRSAEGIEPSGPAGCANPNWTTSLPADITTVKSLKFDFGNFVMQPGDSLELEWPMRAPVNALASIGNIPDTLAWASFGYIGTRVDNNAKLLPAEPLKVGMRMKPYVPAVVGDQVWVDGNGNGIKNNGELGVDGVRVVLYEDDGDGTPNIVNDTELNFTVTANGGFYVFPNLDADNYFLVYYLPPNYTVSPANQGNNDAADSDATASTINGKKIAITPIINLAAGDINLDWDLGLEPNNLASVGDYVWNDQNQDGIQNESSSDGVNGVRVNIYRSNNTSTPYATTLTTNDLDGNPGFYLFEELPPGNYIIEGDIAPSVPITTRGSTGSSDPDDSDINTSTRRTETFNLSANEYDKTWDIGLQLAGVEICNNGIDDDNDGLIDCADCDDCAAECTVYDWDSDGINNFCDLDDDNDGIPDQDECPNFSYGPELINNGNFENGYAYWTSDFNRGKNNNGPTSDGCGTQGWVALSPCASFNGGCLPYYEYNGSTPTGSTLITDPLGSGANVVSTYNCNVSNGNCFAQSLPDHTTGTGLSLYVDPSDVPGRSYWKQTVTIQPNRYYEFSAWIMVIEEDPELVFKINNTNLTDVFNLDRQTGGNGGADVWQPVITSWFSGGASGNVIIELVNVKAGCGGNDMRLDDVSFREIINFCDEDGDGIGNIYDLDSDNDGISDLHEAGHNATDSDDDGIIDGANSTFGTNGLFDNIETSPDSDVINYAINDSENNPDGKYDAYELDSDGDGCFDSREAQVTDDDNNGIAGTGAPTITTKGLVVGITYSAPPSSDWQNPNTSTGCQEVCDNNQDDDGDGLVDCADFDCGPIIYEVYTFDPTCLNKTGGKIIITATGSGTLTYSINNEALWQTNNTFTNLGVGQYKVRVRNDGNCATEYIANPITFDLEPCNEVCDDGIDNDGDGKVDCDDPDCANVGTANSIED